MALPAAVLFSLCITFFTSSCTAQEIRIDSINQKWVKKASTEVKVCLTSESKVDDLNRFHLDIISDSKSLGHVEGPTLETDRRLCFAGITLGKEDLDKAVAFTVSQPGSKTRVTVVETFMIVPQITRMSEDAFQICWTNPDGLTFALDQKDAPQRPRPYHSPCHTCCQALISQSPDDIISLEAEGPGGFRQTVQLHLPRNSITSHSEKVVSLTIKELHKVMRDDDPSGGKQNMKLVWDSPESFEADECILSLTTQRDPQSLFYCETPPDKDATEVEFSGKFVDSSNLILTFKKDNALVAFGSVSMDIKDPGSRVALVGSPSVPALRVDPGGRGEVDVPGRDPCRSDSAPCYYFQEGFPLTPPTLCDDLTSDSGPFKFCDEIVSQVQDPGAPTLELRNRKELIVGTANAQTEVGVRERGGNTNLASDINCAALGDGTCVVQVDVGEEIDILDVMVVMLDEEKFVTGSVVVEFEVHRLSTFSFSSDVVQVSIDPLSEGEFKVEVFRSSSPLEVTTECHPGAECRVSFSAVETTGIVRVMKDNKLVSEEYSTEIFPPASTLKSITAMNSNTILEVVGDRTVNQVTLITFSDNIALEKDYQVLTATPTESGYLVDAALIGEGESEFVIAGYNAPETLLEVSHAHLILHDLSNMVSVVGAPLGSPDSSFRVDVRDVESVVLEDIGNCTREESPCYFLRQESSGSLRRCTTITNSASEDGDEVDQCDETYVPFEGIPQDPALELVDGETLVLTIPGAYGKKLEVVVFDSEDDQPLETSSPECPLDSGLSCSQRVTVPASVKDIMVLAVLLDSSGKVTASNLSPFRDLKTRFQILDDDQDLEVRWQSPEEEVFSLSVYTDNGNHTRSVTCGGPGVEENRKCRSYFISLGSVKIHKVEVRNDKPVSSTTPTSEGTTTPLTITKISQSSKSPPRTKVTFSSVAEVLDVSFVEFVVEEGAGEETIAFVNFYNDIVVEENSIIFDADLPVLNQEITVMVIAHGLEGLTSDAVAYGKETVTLQNIDLPYLTKVGSDDMRSLRVETSSIAVEVNGERCPASGVCLFLEPGNFLDTPEVCSTSVTEVEQCDLTAEYMVPEVLEDLRVVLHFSGEEEQEMTITANFAAASTSMETIMYRENQPFWDFVCNFTSKYACSTYFEPKDTKFKLLLMAFDKESEVTETTALEFEDFQTRIQQLSSDTIEVRWRASQNLEYDIKVDPKPEDGIFERVVQCGGERPEDSALCLAYFLNLKSDQVYTVSVSIPGDNRSVSASVRMEPSLTSIHITSARVTPHSITLCLKETLEDSTDATEKDKDPSYELLLLNANNRLLYRTSVPSPSSRSAIKGELCLDSVPLELDLGNSDSVRVFVLRKDAENRGIATGGMDVILSESSSSAWPFVLLSVITGLMLCGAVVFIIFLLIKTKKRIQSDTHRLDILSREGHQRF